MKVQVTSPQKFEKEIARMNKKARKLGVEEIEFERLGKKEAQRTEIVVYEGQETEQTVPITVTEYEVSAPEVYEDGWRVVATITPMEDDKPFIATRTNDVDKSKYEGQPRYCEHCKSNRHRLQTFVVRHKDGREMQVGRNCMKDLTDGMSVAALEFRDMIFVFLNDEDGIFMEGRGRRESLPVVSVVDCVATSEALYEAYGDWQNNEYDELEGILITPGTHKIASFIVNGVESPHKIFTDKEKLDTFNKKREDIESVESLIEEIKDLEIDEDDEFGQLIQYICTFRFVPDRRASIAAYAGQFLRKRKEREAFEKKKASMKHVGEVGKRQNFYNLTCKKIVSFQGIYGVGFVNICEDESGNAIVWKGTKSLEEGKIFDLKATVKDHSEFRGAPQTLITRAKVIKEH